MKKPRIELSELMFRALRRLLAEGPGTILFDPCTGTGKTFVAALLASRDLARDFDQVIMVTVQNKLSAEYKEILLKQIAADGSVINEDQVLFAKNNIDTLRDAYENRKLHGLYNQISAWINNIPEEEYIKKKLFLEIKNRLTQAKKMIEKHIGDKEVYNDNDEDERPSGLAKGDQLFRNTIRTFFYKYRTSEELSKDKEKAKASFLAAFPMVEKVYPQTAFFEKKVVVCTIHKLLKGIDLIVDRRIKWVDFKNSSFKRCFIFDESDQCFLALRQHLIDHAVDRFFSGSNNNRNYNNFLEVFTIFPLRDDITAKGFGLLAKELIDYLEPIANGIWKSIFPDVRRYRNMYIDPKENMNRLFRRGIFLIGTQSTVKFSYTNKELNSFVAHNEGDTFLTLTHARSRWEALRNFDSVIPIEIFFFKCLALIRLFVIKAAEIILRTYQEMTDEFRNKLNKAYCLEDDEPMEEPTIEKITKSLFCRFNTINQQFFTELTLEHIYNLRNETKGSKKYAKDVAKSNSFYRNGFRFFEEKLVDGDLDKSVELSGAEILTSAEDMMLSLDNGVNTLILSSATADNRSIIANGDMEYYRSQRPETFRSLRNIDHCQLTACLKATYPDKHKIHVMRIVGVDGTNLMESWNSSGIKLPEEYKQFFHSQAVKNGLVDRWFRITMRMLRRSVAEEKNANKRVNKVRYQLDRVLQFVQVYHQFLMHKDIRSMLYFQNPKPTKKNPDTLDMEQQMKVISSLMDGNFKNKGNCPALFDDELPKDWNNPHLKFLEEWEQIKNEVLPKIEESAEEKLMLVTAYGSIKVGCNLQYKAPKGAKVLKGDSWSNQGRDFKKDWDAVYLQLLSNYVSREDKKSNQKDNWREVLKIMMYEGMFYERHYHRKSEVEHNILNALYEEEFVFNSSRQHLFVDKSAWMFGTYNQTIGRICRERNKNENTYIFYDHQIVKYTTRSCRNKSMTPEFEAFIDDVRENQVAWEGEIGIEEMERISQASTQFNALQQDLNEALRYCDRKGDKYVPGTFYLDSEKENREASIEARHRVRDLYHWMARQPTVPAGRMDTVPERFRDYLGDWKRNEAGECWFWVNRKDQGSICTRSMSDRDVVQTYVSAETTRLSVFRKNPVIREYFLANGYALEWGEGKMVHPNFFLAVYPGIIGELACLALLYHYLDITSDDMLEMIEDENHEVVDIVIRNRKNGKPLLGIDVKNFNPYSIPYDRPDDLNAAEKHERKVNRLDCRVVTVNLVQMEGETGDAANEILGLLDEDGNVILSNISKLKELLKGNENEQY